MPTFRSLNSIRIASPIYRFRIDSGIVAYKSRLLVRVQPLEFYLAFGQGPGTNIDVRRPEGQLNNIKAKMSKWLKIS